MGICLFPTISTII